MFLLRLLAVSLSIVYVVGKDELPSADNVSLMLVGFKHGFRNPSQFFKNDSTRQKYDWGWEGEGQTTIIGKQQAYGLGKFLRKRYDSLLPKDVLGNQVKFISPTAGCHITMSVVIAGMFPPVGHAVWDKDLLWQPVAIEANDPMLRMTKMNCPPATKLFQETADKNPSVQAKLKKSRELIEYVAEHGGVNDTLDGMNTANDNIQNMAARKVSPMSDWIEHPTLKEYENKKPALLNDIASFAELRETHCALDKDCSKAMAGLWMNHVVDILKKKSAGQLPDRKAQLYATHTETLLSLMRIMKMTNTNVGNTAGFIIEYKDSPASVRVMYHETDNDDFKVHKAHKVSLPYCEDKDWCPLDTFVKNANENSFSDWKEFCKLPKCDN